MRLTVGAKNFELGTIKPVQPIPRAKPHNSVTVFQTTYNGVLWESVTYVIVLKQYVVVLRSANGNKQKKNDECNVFEDSDNLTIYAPAGSYAEQYAKNNNITFVAE